jgi:uncharacterized protein YdbL (DUF1318 family)
VTNPRAYLFAALLLAAAPAAAQPLPNAIAVGTVGERFDGYMGFAAAPAADVRRQVNAINIKRRNLYIQLASGKNATAELVGLTTACELFSKLAVGQAYLLQDGVWRRRAAGQPAPQPQHCR